MGGGMVDEYMRGTPAPPLRPHVAWYTGYRQRGVPPATHRGLPSPYLTLILTLDDPLVMRAHPDPLDRPGSYTGLVGGLHTRPALIAHDGRQSGVQVALRPLGCRALLGLPAGELAHADVDAADVLGPAVAEVRQRLLAAADWPARFAVLDAALTARLRDAAVRPEVAYAWRVIERGRGTVPVAAIAARTGWSARHLAGRFRAEVGLSPKTAAMVARFDRARRMPGPLAAVAAACGYADQAHLARDVRAFAGVPLSVLRAEEFPFVQAMAAGAADDGEHDH
ncbi:helix-turn-helix domain-containing protein [Spirilliplanes yamanashiensis]|uniref:AraC family transcriptional regulator n=1 Tax=Spirilliplanes yamanashiensis TaxID=42233 RepID=A0A8J4DLE8_9ACTN|nr:helix-turn-helix domain-containing protein [Spirilliplanes yamanashiensis]MDP9818719.1 AraC-like DNA-binding protein [Spirilliplanes yamanashiensis]GIJ05174.1 AraC family transcriptional regulator [Spirilliplanes yamanashiensis]